MAEQWSEVDGAAEVEAVVGRESAESAGNRMGWLQRCSQQNHSQSSQRLGLRKQQERIKNTF